MHYLITTRRESRLEAVAFLDLVYHFACVARSLCGWTLTCCLWTRTSGVKQLEVAVKGVIVQCGGMSVDSVTQAQRT